MQISTRGNPPRAAPAPKLVKLLSAQLDAVPLERGWNWPEFKLAAYIGLGNQGNWITNQKIPAVLDCRHCGGGVPIIGWYATSNFITCWSVLSTYHQYFSLILITSIYPQYASLFTTTLQEFLPWATSSIDDNRSVILVPFPWFHNFFIVLFSQSFLLPCPKYGGWLDIPGGVMLYGLGMVRQSWYKYD